MYAESYFAPWTSGSSGSELDEMKRRTFSGYLELLGRHRRRGGRLLDVGCALGAFMAAARDRGYETVGVDVNPHAVERTGARFPEVYLGSIEKLDLEPSSYDVVVMTDVIEHVNAPASFLQRARRLLKPGGHLLLTTPDTASLSCALMGRRWPHYKLEHLFYFNERTMRHCLSGFEVLEMQPVHKHVSPTYLGNVLGRYASSRFLESAGNLAAAMGRLLGNPPLRLRTGEMLLIARHQGPAMS